MGHFDRATPLPRPLTPIFGRDAEAAALIELLSHSSRQIVTICGPGGIGKSRLALHLAAELQSEFAGRLGYLSLESCFDANQAFAQMGKLLDADWLPESGLPSLALANGTEKVLLVLDNIEQIPGFAPKLSQLMQLASALSILVTSQHQLDIDGETVFRLEPLPVPPPVMKYDDSLAAEPAVQLFLHHKPGVGTLPARSAIDYGTIAEICRKLEGVPLAIQLAASRSHILPPAALLPLLDSQLTVLTGNRPDLPHRLRTLRNAIQWSFDLLDPNSRTVFLYLCVYQSGFDVRAVETVSQHLPNQHPGVDMLEILIAHSMVLSVSSGPEGRFKILSAWREFGVTELESERLLPDAQSVRAAYIRDIVTTSHDSLTGHHQQDSLKKIDINWGTIRETVENALATGQPEIALHLAGNLWRYAEIHGTSTELANWLDLGLADPADTEISDLAQAWIARGYMHVLNEDWDAAIEAFQNSTALTEASRDIWMLTNAYCGLGRSWRGKQELALAHYWLDQAEVLALRCGNQRAFVTVIVNRAELAVLENQPDSARALLTEGINRLHAMGDVVCMAATISRASEIEMLSGNLDNALRLLEHALVIDRSLESVASLSQTLLGMGKVWHAIGNENQAITYLEEAIDVCETHGLTSTGLRAKVLLSRIRKEPSSSTFAITDALFAISAPGIESVVWTNDLTQNRDATHPVQIEGEAAETGMPLTPREAEVLNLLTMELSTEQIAEVLSISHRTVNTHIGNILSKFGVKTRTAAVARAMSMSRSHPSPT